ncbi:MAG: hypothetical protein U5L45_16620 [Saprospiraceae bacterium]|nr:hypothetical protein [Saprospiraceae bacterium]
MVRFSAKPKNEPHSPPSRERSEREMQKTLLGYAHPSNSNSNFYGYLTILVEGFSTNASARFCSLLLASLAKKEERWFIFRAKPEK